MANILQSLWLKLGDPNYKRALRFQLQIRPYLHGVPYWVAAVIVGLVAVLYSHAFNAMIDLSQRVALENRYVFLGIAPFAFILSSVLVARLGPAAGGSGIPSVLRALSLENTSTSGEVRELLGMKVAGICILSSLLVILGGAGLGREGPMVQIAACIFYFIGQQFRKIWPTDEHRSWIVAGGAAGLAAAFNTPLAGIVFVLEELAQQHFHQFKTVIISAVIIAGMISQWLFGRYLFLGYPLVGSIGINVFPAVIAVGILCGVAAGLFERILTVARSKTAGLLNSHRILFSGSIGLLAAGLVLLLGSQTIGGGVNLMEHLLFQEIPPAGWKIVLSRFIGPIVATLSGCSGGFLAPSLSLGAVIGSKFSALVMPNDHNLLVLVGMAGALSAISRAPFTALVIVMEMTDRHSIIFPLMIASLISQATVRAIAGRFSK